MFYTHWELGQLQRLTFGINSTQGVFHEEIKQTLVDIYETSMTIYQSPDTTKQKTTLYCVKSYNTLLIVESL